MRNLVLSCITALSIFFAGHASADELDNYGPAPAIELTESTGKTFNSASLKGKVWIVHFFFSSCPSVCPALLSHIEKLQKETSKIGEVHLLSISVDPEHDTPAELAEFRKRFHAGERWHFLTGPIETVGAILRNGFKLDQGAKPDFHTTRVILVDQEGAIRGYYQGLEDEAMKELGEAMEELAQK